MLRTLAPRTLRSPLALRALSTRPFTATAFRKEDDLIANQFKHIQTQPTAGKDGTSASDLARRLSQAVLPKLERPNVKKVCIVGSGGLSIGQAGEFDYSGEFRASSVAARGDSSAEGKDAVTGSSAGARRGAARPSAAPCRSQHTLHKGGTNR